MKRGPLLPENFYYHCSVLVDNIVYLIGGLDTQSKVLAIDIRTFGMTYKRNLNRKHARHSCALINGSDPKIIVSGGYDSKLTDIYDIVKDSWEIGK